VDCLVSWKECLWHILREVDDNPLMSEDELYGVLIRAGFFEELGYGKFGVDVKPQYVVPGERKKADYVCRDEYQNVIFVLEAKKPREERLEDALEQLWERYVLPLKAFYGVLTNGKRFIVYKRAGISPEPLLDFDLKSASEADCNQLHRILKKPEYDLTLHSKVQEYFEKVEKLSLKTELAKENFFETFKLNPESIFGKLVADLMKLFDWVYPRSKFLKGAYGFWRRSFARQPERIPDSWKPFLMGDGDVFKFMFCLESAHALLARLILAKACEDLRFPGIGISIFVVQKIHQFRGQIPLVGYPIVLLKLLKEMKDQLVYSIFEEDIFSWWSDAFVSLSEKSSGELLQEKVDEELEDFSKTIARLLFILYKYDFSEVAGDPLGDLYQQYFDKETRKALGEFYTPVEVVNYILDAVEYKYVRHKRLLDPACGSGTFLVEALKRYLKEMKPVAKEKGWAFVLRELCNSPRIVGFDIHPFACLIAQVRFMMELIPYYKEAIEEEKLVVYESLQRLPIFRTDSLLIEMRPAEIQRGPKLLVTEEDIRFIVSLPIKANGEEMVSVKVTIPSWKKASVGTKYNLFNLDEYFCVTQALFDAIKGMVRVEADEVPTKILEANIKKYLSDKEFHIIAEFFKPYADNILLEIKRLRKEFGDGRLIKSIEDMVLAAILKNYITYDFVVGNPPYINVRMIKRMVGKSTEDHYKQVYETAKGLYDVYCLFIEKGLMLLSRDGRLGYICSNQFMLTDYGKYLRKILVERAKINHILDFRDSGVFIDVVNYPCIIILTKSSKKEELKANKIKFVRVFKPTNNILESIKNNYENENFSTEWFDMFTFPQSLLTEDAWRIMPEQEHRVFEKIKKAADVTFKEIAEDIFVGTQTSADDIYLVFITEEINERLVKIKPKGVEKEYIIEKEILKPLLKGKDVSKWAPMWSKHWLIFPYRKDNPRILLTERELREKYPNTWEYFITHKNIMEQRENGRWKGSKTWYEFGRPNNHEKFEQVKLMTQLLSTGNKFALDLTGKFFFIAVGGDCITLKAQYKNINMYKFILGLLNSRVLEYFLKHISPVHEGGFYLYIKQYLEEFPIVLPNNKKKKEMMDKIVNKVETIFQQIGQTSVIDDYLTQKLHYYQQEGVEFDKIQFTFCDAHDKLKPVVSSEQGKNYIIYPGEGEDPIWVDSEQKAMLIATILLNKSVHKGETFEIIVPKDDSVTIKIIEDLKERLTKIEKTSIEELEKEINETVYRLYELSSTDIAVIEDFLKKF
jgi:type I restriction-modification system DNA methylase subunit